MSFLNPAVLFGVLLVGVPIAIHLLNKNRIQEIRWPMMKFLRNIVKRNEKKLRIEDLILLICRCLIVALLALAFARPTLWFGGGTLISADPVAAVLLLDVSGSMGYGNGVETRLDSAKKTALEILANLASGSSCALYLVSDQVQPLIPRPTTDMSILRKSILNTQVSERGSDLSEGVQQAATLLKSLPDGEKEIFVITDNQAEAWKGSRKIQKLVEDNSGQIAFKFISVADRVEPNLAVTQMELEGGVAAVNTPLSCRVAVSNWSGQAAANVRITLSADGDSPMNETVIPSIPPNSSQTVILEVKFRDPGYHSLTATIPPDRLPYDNQRAVCLQVVDESRVLIVDGTPTADPVDREGFFLAQALQPVPKDKIADYYLKLVRKGPENIPLDNLGQFDSIILADVAQVNAATTSAISSYVSSGGSLMIFTGPNTERGLNFWQKDSHMLPLLPAKLLGVVDAPTDKKYITLQTKGYGHPVVSIWNDPQNGNFGEVKYARHFSLEPVDVPTLPANVPTGEARLSRVQSILDFSTGKPAVIEGTFGLGKVVLFASTPNTSWNTFPIHPAFVPFMQRLLGYLSRRFGDALIVSPGQTFIHTVPTEFIGQNFFVRRPEQKNSNLAGKIEEGTHGGVVRYRDTGAAGAYALFMGEKKKPFIVFASQPDPRESDLSLVDSKELDAVLAAAKVSEEKLGQVSGKTGHRLSGTPHELWVYFIVLAFLLAIAELVMAHRFSMPK